MSANPITVARGSELAPRQIARFPNLKALAWSGVNLYASSGYNLLCADLSGAVRGNKIIWRTIADYRPVWWRNLTASQPLSYRLFRDGFHALAIIPDFIRSSMVMIAAVPGAIVALRSGEAEFRRTHRILRGTRPLHIAALPNGVALWGEYFDNSARNEVHIYASADSGQSWDVAYTFPRGSVRHIHNVVHDRWQDCLWILTGDYGDECQILRSSCDLKTVDVVMKGNQQARAVALIPTHDGVYFSSDTPLENNFIFHLNRNGNLSRVAQIPSSSICGCRVKDDLFFSTMAEPSECNTNREVQLYRGSAIHKGQAWSCPLTWAKDRWPMRFFQYGNAFMPDGDNSTNILAIATVAVHNDDLVTSLYEITR